MRKFLLILVTSLFAFSMMGQKQYVNFDFGGGLQSFSYDLRLGASATKSLGISGDLKYVYFFDKNWGAGTGVGMYSYRAKSKLDGEDVHRLFDEYNQLEYDYTTAYHNWTEKQRMVDVEVPLMAYYETDVTGDASLLFGLGGKVVFPISYNYTVTGGYYETTGYYPDYNLTIDKLEHHGFGRDETPYSGKLGSNIGFSLCFELDLMYWFDNFAFYVGTYGAYGLSDMTDHDKLLRDVEQHYNGMLASDQTDKVSLINFGFRLGITLPMNRPEGAVMGF